MMQPLGTIEQLPLREIWKDEARDFTPWLANEGLPQLADILGVELELKEMECAVGGYRADILAKVVAESEDEEHLVIIENQLDTTNHDHLGKIITYAAGKEAVTVVWVAADFREEHRQAMDWLNKHFKNISWFALQITAIRIGDSAPAPQFKVVSSPNETVRMMKRTTTADRQNSETGLGQIQFWEDYLAYANEQSGQVQYKKKALGDYLYSIRVAKGFQLNIVTNIPNRYCRVELYFDGVDAKTHYDSLLKKQSDIEDAFCFHLNWDNEEGTKGCRASYRADLHYLNPDQRQDCIEWLYATAEEFYRVFMPMIQSL